MSVSSSLHQAMRPRRLALSGERLPPAPAARHEGGSRPVQAQSRVRSTVASASPKTRQADAATSATSVVLRPRPPSAHASWSASATRRTAATSAATAAAKMMSRSCSAPTAEVPSSSYSASNSSSFRSRPAVGGQGASSATATTRRSENPCRRYCARHRPASGTLRCRCPQHPDPGPIVVYTSCAIAIPAPCRTACPASVSATRSKRRANVSHWRIRVRTGRRRLLNAEGYEAMYADRAYLLRVGRERECDSARWRVSVCAASKGPPGRQSGGELFGRWAIVRSVPALPGAMCRA